MLTGNLASSGFAIRRHFLLLDTNPTPVWFVSADAAGCT
jgi:hypothetical protein